MGNRKDCDFTVQKDFCRKYRTLLWILHSDEKLRQWCIDYSYYAPATSCKDIVKVRGVIRQFLKEAYDANLVITDYREVIEAGGIDEALIGDPQREFIEKLNEKQIIACIAWHFRRDHFIEGSLMSKSIADGELLRYFEALLGITRTDHMQLTREQEAYELHEFGLSYRAIGEIMGVGAERIRQLTVRYARYMDNEIYTWMSARFDAKFTGPTVNRLSGADIKTMKGLEKVLEKDGAEILGPVTVNRLREAHKQDCDPKEEKSGL